MAETPLTPRAIIGPYPVNPQSITTQLLIAPEAADAAAGNSFPYTAKDILMVQNSGSVDRTFTVIGQPDAQLRKGNIGPITLHAGEVAFFDFTSGQVGWRDTNGNILLAASHADIKFAALTHK